MAGRGRAASVRIGRLVRDALGELLDQRTPFGRLALVHVLLTAGDTLVTISLAGSLFFSISPTAAKDRVLLYLVLTMAPFAVVAPFLGPVIDQSRGARRAMVVTSAACRAVMCLVMAGALKSLLLFPEAFTMLVLSKIYLVTKGSLVPLLAGRQAVNGDPPSPAGAVGGAGVVGVAGRVSGAEVVGASASGVPAQPVNQDILATSNAQLGLLAALTGFAASLPAIAVLKLLGGPWVLRLDMLVFAAGTVAALRLPIRSAGRPGRIGRSEAGEPGPASEGAAVRGAGGRAWGYRRSSGPLSALGPGVNTSPEVTLALSAMSVLKGIVGFLTFFLAFSLRRMHTATWWYGFMLGSSVAGTVVGVLLVPRARRFLTEQQVIASTVWLVAVFAVLAGVVGGLVIQALLAFVIGVAGSAAKPAFDALVQRYVPPAAQGRAFARFETRLQMVWVLGALLPVVATLPLSAGDIIIAAVAGVSALSYMTGRRAVSHRAGGGP